VTTFVLRRGADAALVLLGLSLLMLMQVHGFGEAAGLTALIGLPWRRRGPPEPADASRSISRAHHMCVREIHATFEGTILALGQALELRDYETQGHTARVVVWTDRLTLTLGLTEAERRAVRWGAYLHDIGKLAIPDAILLKPGRLDESEWAVMQEHAVHGVRMLREVPSLPDETRDVVRSHHERWDGGGYPDGLAGEAIPLHARSFAVVDVWDALTHSRPYKEPWSRRDARAEIERGAGTQFDPVLARRFLDIEEVHGTADE